MPNLEVEQVFTFHTIRIVECQSDYVNKTLTRVNLIKLLQV